MQHFDDEKPHQAIKKLKIAIKAISPFIRSLQKECGFRTADGKVRYQGVEVDEKAQLEKEAEVGFIQER